MVIDMKFIMCFSEETKERLIRNGYKLLNEVKTGSKTIYFFKNEIDSKLTFSKDEVVYTNKLFY